MIVVYSGMALTLRRLRRRAFVPVVALALAGCDVDNISLEVPPLAGSFTTTIFRVIPPGQPVVDVLAAGGSLSVVINSDNTMTGLLKMPAGLIGASAIEANMAGTVTKTSTGRLRFQQTADTFVRELEWFEYTNALTTTTNLGGTQFEIALTRQ